MIDKEDIKIEIPLVLLAGGKSSRMKTDKTVLPFKGYKTIVEYQVKRFEPFFNTIYISTKDKNKFKNKNFNYLIDRYNSFSPIFAIKSIFETVNEKEIFILSADTPFVTIKTIKTIIQNSTNYEAVLAKTSFKHNLCGIYKKTILDKISKEDENKKLGEVIKRLNHLYIHFNNEEEFFNINFKKDYIKALSIQKQYFQ